MTTRCLNHRNLTYDICRTCNGKMTDCPEYLSDIEYTSRVLKAEKPFETTDYETTNKTLVANSKPFYFGHVELYHTIVLPNVKRFMYKFRRSQE